MLENEIVSVKISNPNRKYYENILNAILNNGDIINVKQSQIPLTSRTKVLCKCDLCGECFYRIRRDVKTTTLCSKKCRNEFLVKINPNPSKPKIKVNCEICSKEFDVFKSKYENQDNFLCSRECYKKHRSLNYNGEKLYNYQSKFIKCDNDDCNKLIKTSNYYLGNNKHQFCSQSCYWIFKSKHYREYYYVPQLFEERKETTPEKMVREYLDKNNIKYIQEYNIDKYYVDFYIPKKNLIIEVFGDYWHVNPKIYGNEEGKRKLHKNQIGKREQDEIRLNYLKSKGYVVHIIWEYDVYEDLEHHLSDALLLCT